jgi:hypothetical protein
VPRSPKETRGGKLKRSSVFSGSYELSEHGAGASRPRKCRGGERGVEIAHEQPRQLVSQVT